MQWLARHDYDCTVLTAYPYYPHWCVQPPYAANKWRYTTGYMHFEDGKRLLVHRVPMYVPATPSGLKRIMLDISFSCTAFFKLLLLFTHSKYDVVLTIAPSFHVGLLGVLGKRIWRAKLLYHIQDMQIEVAQSLRMITSRKVIEWLFKIEKYILKQADTISSISEGMASRIAQKAQKEVVLFPNWVDTKLIYPLSGRAALKESFGLSAAHTVLLYSGAIGEKQGLQAILLAAKEFAQHAALQFVICGSGPYLKTLQLEAARLQVANVRFLPLQPPERLNALLNMADVHFVMQKASASDLVMPSKLTNILAVGGLALITANPDSGLYQLVAKHRMGVLVAAENQAALHEGIRFALTQNTAALTQQARAYAERHLTIDAVMQRFVAQAM